MIGMQKKGHGRTNMKIIKELPGMRGFVER
jgi:hypothetical protein